MPESLPALMPEMMGADWVLTFSGWAATYLLHSTVAIGGAWLLQRFGLVHRPSARDVLWKAALLVGVISASVQLVGPALMPQARAGHLLEERISSLEGSQGLKRAVRHAAGPLAAAGANRSIEVEARLRNPSDECLRVLRGGPVGVLPGVQRLTGACASAPWVSRFPWFLFGFWILGAGIAGLRLWAGTRALGGLLAHRELVSGGYAREALDELLVENPRLGRVDLYRVEGLESPAALTRREIGLPARAAEMPSGELRVAMAHEVAHLVRRDPVWMWVTTVLSAALFFQPLNRLAQRNLRETAELLADDWAVERTGAPLTLARSLARVAEWLTPHRPAPVLAMAGAEGAPLGRRVERILGTSDRRPVSRLYALGFSSILLFALAAIPRVDIPAPSTVRVLDRGPAEAAIGTLESGAVGDGMMMRVLIEG